MDLPQLFASRRAALEQQSRGSGSTRAMAERARVAGRKISHVQLAAYARGEFSALPSAATREVIAAALGVSFDEVTAAAWASVAPEQPEGPRTQYAQTFLRLTEGRTDAEIRQTLGVVEATLRAMAASRETVGESSGPDEDHPGT